MNLYRTTPQFGITSRRDILLSGITRREYDAALSVGDLIRIDRSRVALRGTPESLITAARAGATVSCLSALAHHGVDTLPTQLLHVRRSAYCSRTRPLPAGMLRCNLPTPPEDEIIDSLETALRATLSNHGNEHLLVCLDSILRKGLRTRQQLTPWAESVSARAAWLVSLADGRSDSPLETVIRFRLHKARIHATPQVELPGIGHVDLLVGKSLILEADGRQHHSSPEQFEKDHLRDQQALMLGYRTIRITWQQIRDDWPRLHDIIRNIVRSRLHLRAPRPFFSPARATAP
ncbi:MAG: DUF559 domain-containing protein [Propionibacteriaceae bacterium]|nr:DUF559 domain-containing protein [Propionibacteriaceae bacterium]